MWNRKIGPFASLMMLVGCLLATAAVAAGDDDVKVRVHKKVVIDCADGDTDCGHRLIFIDDDGGTRHIGGHGLHHRLFSGGHHGDKGGFLGVMLSELTPELRGHFGVSEEAGVMVSKVVDDSPASRIGIQVGDIIAAVNGEAVSSSRGLAKAIRSHEDGATVDLEVWRDGLVQTLSPAVEERQGHSGRAIKIDCGDGEDCDFDFNFDFHHAFDFDCGDEDCDVEVDCEDGDCDCMVNGEAVDCHALRGLHTDD